MIGLQQRNMLMGKYPVEIPYTFSVDLDIQESQIPFVKISVLTDNLPEETIDFNPTQSTPSYTPTWYIYGDDTLLYFGSILTSSFGVAASLRYTAKYLSPTIALSKYKVYWDSNSITESNPNKIWNLYWFQQDGKYRPSLPSYLPTSPQIFFPYSNITIKRNIGLSAEVIEGTSATILGNVLTDLSADFSQVVDGQGANIISGTGISSGIYEITAHTSTTLTLGGNPKNNDIGDIAYSISLSWNVAQDVNPTYDVPYYFSYPNLKLRPIMRFPSVQMTTSKVWLKLGTAKYRLTVYGRFCKWTNKQVKVGGTYIEGTYNYVPFYEEVTPGEWQGWYKLDSYTEITRNIVLYEPEYHPSNVRLLVNYVNNSGQNEVRKYSL